MYEKLEVEPRNTNERHLVCSSINSIVLSQDTMDRIELILQGLETEMQSNYEVAREIIESIKHISEKLNLPCDLASKQKDFYSSRMIEEFRQELKCLEEERKKHMSIFIKSAASDLEQLWEKCYASDDVKTAFNSILDTKDDDEELILTHYESNIKAWMTFFEDHRLIISKIHEWYGLWNDRLELETCMKDPSRLGNFKMLREEEKKRNRVNKRLPKIVEEIERLAATYHDEKGKDFLIYGLDFHQLNERQQRKHEQAVLQVIFKASE